MVFRDKRGLRRAARSIGLVSTEAEAIAGEVALVSARAQRWAPGERTRPHAQARTERRRDVAEGVSAGRAAAVVGDRTSGIRAQPAAAGRAQRIDALHRQAGQVLHRFTSMAAKRESMVQRHRAAATPWRTGARTQIG